MRSIIIFILLSLACAINAQPLAIPNLPKIELHLHIDCSLSYAVVHRLDPTITPEIYDQQFIAPARCTNLADYIRRADREIDLMQTPQQLRLATLDLFTQLRRDHVIYAEMRFAPLQHCKKGLSPKQVVAIVDSAVAEGIQKTGIQAGLILCTLRHYSEEQSIETVKLAEEFHRGNRHVVGFDIAADEAGYPITHHIAAFQYAHDHGIPCTAHAGEAKGAESVRETLANFHPSRIGHGVRSAEDSSLLQYLRQHHIHLEVCPTSNLQTNIYPTLADHPVDRLYHQGLSVSINTDGRTISNTTLDREYAQLATQFHWTKKDFLTCNLEALDHAFTSDAIKARLRAVLIQAYGNERLPKKSSTSR
ncbi:MAG TPA: adenosine deaminase [Puia sp.]|uniref:adenosine deaminase n=1 Tax=Puia sp. TaxID=2045100 RepID=UPI002C644E6C|nr:adenosine deaminase [Puia sp.]HVU98647.1 adenosine deaminase [Puia sp.]